jgi:DNA-binding CsgD family transcriptional regulator
MNVVSLEVDNSARIFNRISDFRDVQTKAAHGPEVYALIQTDRFGHVLSQNWTAQDMLRQETVFRVEHSVLMPLERKDDDRWFSLLLETSRSMAPRVILLTGDSRKTPVAVTPNHDRTLEIRIQIGIAVSERTLSVAFSSLGLTESERDVLRCLLNGLKPKTIASQKFRSESTVRSHIKSLLAKCGCNSLQEVIVLFGRLPEMA